MPGGNTDPLVVRTEELSSVLREWVKKHSAQYPTSSGYGNLDGYSAMQYMRTHSHYPISDRVLYRILSNESIHTSFAIADSLLSAVDQNHALHDGRVEVLQNPQWSMTRWLTWKEEQGCV